MSYYYNYYIGYEHDGKIYPLGPYDCNNKIRDAISKSRSFASNLHDDFCSVPENMISDELRKEFEYEDWNGNKTVDVKYLPISELPEGSFIKRGYFLISDVKAYEENDDTFDLFYENLNPTLYAAKLQNELTFGKPGPKKDCEGEEYTEPSASDFMYYAYPDYNCKEYEAHIIRTFANSLGDYNSSLPKGYKLVVLETEG